MKQSICEIFLNPNGHCDGVYHSGQKLSGYVLLTFYEKQKINSESPSHFVCVKFYFLSQFYYICDKSDDDEFEKNFAAQVFCSRKLAVLMFI